ncbi:MAG: acyl carrier protein [Clostridia bacterium]
MADEILLKVKELISEQFGIDKDKITKDTSFIDDLSADSLDLVELIMAIEEEFDIEIEDTEVEVVKTVGDVVDYISALNNA